MSFTLGHVSSIMNEAFVTGHECKWFCDHYVIFMTAKFVPCIHAISLIEKWSKASKSKVYMACLS